MVTAEIPIDELDPSAWELEPEVEKQFQRLLNYIESLRAENQTLKEENARLKAQLAKCQGQPAPPQIKPNRNGQGGSQPSAGDEQSSADEKKNNKKTQKRKDAIHIDRDQKVPLDREGLPADFQSLGYREVVVQNVIFKTENVCYRLERGHSPSTGQFYEAKLPEGVQPGYAAELEALVIMLYYQLRVPQPKIHALLSAQGIVISRGQIAQILTHKHLKRFGGERRAVLLAGLAATPFQQIDDTGMRVDGVGHHVTTLCSPYYSCFFTNHRKNAQTVAQLLDELDSEAKLGDWVEILIGDDAPQFHGQTEHRGLCWIHEERHYKKLRPFFKTHEKLRDDFRGEIWDFYDELKAYKQRPTKKEKRRLSKRFDELFGRTTGYENLDDRIRLTKAKKEHLLLVLEFPELPLENNESERSLREWVIKRRISGGTRSPVGTRAWDVFLSLVDSCRKQGLQFYEYVVECLRGRRPGWLARSIAENAGCDDPEFIAHLQQQASL